MTNKQPDKTKKTKPLNIEQNVLKNEGSSNKILFSLRNRNNLIAVLMLVLINITIFSGSLPNNFTFDDIEMVVSNDLVNDLNQLPVLWGTNFNEGYKGSNQGLYRPLINTFYSELKHTGWIFASSDNNGVRQADGLVSWYFRIFNILLHLFNSVLIYYLVNYLSKNWWVAVWSSLLFATAAVHVEAVICISRLSDVIACTFTLLTLLTYINYSHSIVEVRKLSKSEKSGMILGIVSLLFFIILYIIDSQLQGYTLNDIEKNRLNIFRPIFEYLSSCFFILTLFSFLKIKYFENNPDVKKQDVKVPMALTVIGLVLLFFTVISYINYISKLTPVENKSTYLTVSLISICISIILLGLSIFLFSKKHQISSSPNKKYFIITCLSGIFLVAFTFIFYSLSKENSSANDIKNNYRTISSLVNWLAIISSIASVFFYIKYKNNYSKGFYFSLSLLFFSLGLFSKESSYLTIVVIFGYDFFFHDLSETNKVSFLELAKRSYRRFITTYSMYFCLLFLNLILILCSVGSIAKTDLLVWSYTENPLVFANFSEQIFTGFKMLGMYVSLMLFPSVLKHDYSYNAVPLTNDLFEPAVFIPFIVLSLISVYVLLDILFWRKNRLLNFSFLFFICTYFVISNWVKIIGTNMAERLIYLPSVGFYIFLIVGLYTIFKYLLKKDILINSTVTAFIVCFVFYNSYKVIERNEAWETEHGLYVADYGESPNTNRVCQNISTTTLDKVWNPAMSGGQPTTYKPEDLQKIINMSKSAIQIDPTPYKCYYSMGISYILLGEIETGKNEIMKIINRSLKERVFLDAVDRIHQGLLRENDWDIFSEYLKTLKKSVLLPDEEKIINYLLTINNDQILQLLKNDGNYNTLINMGNKYIKEKVDFYSEYMVLHNAIYNLSIALQKVNRLDEAISILQLGVKRFTGFKRPDLLNEEKFYTEIGAIYTANNQFENAIEVLLKSVEINKKYAPGNYRPFMLLAHALFGVKKYTEAEPYIKYALQLNPYDRTVLLIFSNIKKMQSRQQEVVPYLQQYLKMNPQDQEIKNILQQLGL